MSKGKLRIYTGTIGCIYETIDYNGYRGWLTNNVTGDVYKIKSIVNSSFPLDTGDTVTYLLDGKVAINVKA